MTTGVDCKTCKVIVLDQTIRSMTEFKQIIGRGTRIEEDYGKLYFTILDFRKATELFADPDFDGEPVQVYRPTSDDAIAPPDDDLGEGINSDPGANAEVPTHEPPTDVNYPDDVSGDGPDGEDGKATGKRVKYVVHDVPVFVVAERVQYYGKDGKLITESLRDYSKNAILERYKSLDSFLKTWTDAARKQAILKELEDQGIFFDELAREVGKDLSAFDLVCHVAFDQPPLTRKERASNVRKRNYFTKYGAPARAVLEALLDKFANEGVDDIENPGVLRVQPISAFGMPMEIVDRFGGKDAYVKAIRELEEELFRYPRASERPAS
jgi:type I restriction enzyme R subunit